MFLIVTVTSCCGSLSSIQLTNSELSNKQTLKIMCYFLQQAILVFASHLLVCVYSEPGCSSDTPILCPSFNLSDRKCNGSLSGDGFSSGSIIGSSLEYEIIPNSEVHDVSLYDYEAFVIPGGCNVSQVTPLDIFSENVLSSPCSTVRINRTSNSLSFSCTMQPNVVDTGIVIYTGSGGPSCGFTGTALVALLDYSQPNCYPCQDNEILQFCPTLFSMPTCYYNYSTLPPNGGLTFEFTGHDIEYTIKPENAVYNVSKIEFHTVGFQLMCNKSFLCSEVRVNQSENSLSVNCELEPGIGNFNVEIQIFITGDCGSDRTAIIFVYDYSQSNCTAPIPVCEQEYDCNNLTDRSQIYDCWVKCAYYAADFNRDECFERQCNKFFNEVCSLECGGPSQNSSGQGSTSDVGPHCSIMCSDAYRYNSDSQCMDVLQTSPCEFYPECPDYSGIDCNQNETECVQLCGDSNSLRSDCRNGLENLFEYCATIPVDPNCSSSSLLVIDCEFPIDARCDSICSLDIYDMIGTICPQAIKQFCADYLTGILNSSLITISQYQRYLKVVDNLVGDIKPGATVQQIEALINNLGDFLLVNNISNTELLVDIFDDLLDDEVSPLWIEEDENAISEDSALLSIESIGMKVSMDLMDSQKAPSFEFVGENFVFGEERPAISNVFNNRYNVSRTLNSREGGGGTLQVPIETLCGNNALGNCTSVVMMAVMRNMADYLHKQATSNPNATLTDYSSFKPNTHLIAVQVFGVPDLKERLAQTPLDIFFNRLQTNTTVVNISTSTCVYWDHNKKTWSTNGVTTSLTSNNDIKCTSTHLTSFAVLVSFNSKAFDNRTSERIAINVVSYIGCAISIVCLTATIFCLVIFRKILNKGSLLYIHLNLSIALLLGYVTFVVGIETAIPIPGLCTFVAALIQYFFLCVFCWMLAEGIMLYLLVVRVFGTAAQKWYWLLILGWGLPVPIVAISAGVLRDYYGNENYCWISSDPTRAALWTFVVPVLIVVIINTVILVLTVVSIVRGKKHGGAETGVSNVTLAKTAIRGAVILLPLLGLTWVIGLFAVSGSTTVFAWLFVMCNSIQGLFIFILHVLRNRALLRKIRQICSRRSPETSDRSSSSGYANKLITKLSTLESVEDNKRTLLHSLPIVNSNGVDVPWPSAEKLSVTVFVGDKQEDILLEKKTNTNNSETSDDIII